jgi:MFS superfamily sulfate permease-like transporter
MCATTCPDGIPEEVLFLFPLKPPSHIPSAARLFFFISVVRNAFVVLILTIAAWLYTRHRVSAKGTYPIKILQTVPRGLKHVGQPTIDRQLVSALAPELPVATIILLLEHIAISKCKAHLKCCFVCDL